MSDQTPIEPLDPTDSISLQDAVDYTSSWRQYISELDPSPDYIRAFNIPIDDIRSLGNLTQADSVRAYLGLGSPGDISTLKLVLVGVTGRNADILFTADPESGKQLSSMYDFTVPCPQTCDVDSPLFTGIMP